MIDQGVVFEQPYTIQMIQPIMLKTKTGQQDFDQITFMLSHVNQPKQFCKRQMFLKSQTLQSELPQKLEASNSFTLALLETMGQGVSFEPSYTIQMLKHIMVKTKSGQQDFDQITFMLSHVNQAKQFCKREMFLKSRKTSNCTP